MTIMDGKALFDLLTARFEALKANPLMPPRFLGGYQRAVLDAKEALGLRTPREIARFQMTATARWDRSTWPTWVTEATATSAGQPGSLWAKDDQTLYLGTVEGAVEIHTDDWLVRLDNGDIEKGA